MQHEWKEHIHSLRRIDGRHGSDRFLVSISHTLLHLLPLINYSVPATYASFPILHQLFARLGMDDNIDTSVSTFSAEMREIAFILRNIDRRSL
jgi:hypothetical protein